MTTKVLGLAASLYAFPPSFSKTKQEVLEPKSHVYLSVENKVRESASSTDMQTGDLTKDILLENRHEIHVYSASTHKVITIIITLPVIINIINYIPAVL